MDIELISDKPVKTKPYRMSPRQINILREEIKRLLELGVIEIGQSDYTSPLILVESPNKDPRPCVDYRRLNEITRAEFFPLPNMEEIVEKVSAAPM
ncbi:retrovirus-related Pol polyprotein from transposon 17.6 [Trichonephila clavipes]|nr:retrovirus-related Pol polyprotein from transposon 17.6 [Trichonephila clavipes]